mmetsp:Transcript_71879/g.185395  ORF Transcript_71879/g.185395 Transcript_71879/m.185395 type:complete len:368 (-) Transcript_71879:312-1415(-)
MSEVGSFTGHTASVCVVNWTRPSRKGGVVSRTTTATRFSSSSFEKSRSFSLRSPRPAWLSRLSSHISLASFFSRVRRLTRSTAAAWRFILSSFSCSFFGSISSSTACEAPSSSASYHCLSSFVSSIASISASALIFSATSSFVSTSSVIEAYCRSLSSRFLIPPFAGAAISSSASSLTFVFAAPDLLPLKKTGWPTGVFFCACSRRFLAASQRSAELARLPAPSGLRSPLRSRLRLRAPPLRPVCGRRLLSFGASSDSASLLTASSSIVGLVTRAAATLALPSSASGSSSSEIDKLLGLAAAFSSLFCFAILSRPRADVRERAWKGTMPAPSRLRMPPSMGALAPRTSGLLEAPAASSISTRFWIVM